MVFRELQERERPWDIDSLVRSGSRMAPQALLRDLHRPVARFTVHEWEYEKWEMAGLRGLDLEEAERRAREAMRTRYQIRFQDFATASTLGTQGYRELKRTIALPWPDAPRKTKRALSTAEVKRWFPGAFG